MLIANIQDVINQTLSNVQIMNARLEGKMSVVHLQKMAKTLETGFIARAASE